MSMHGQFLKVSREKKYSLSSRLRIMQAIGNCKTKEQNEQATLLATEIINSGATEEQAVQRILRELAAL